MRKPLNFLTDVLTQAYGIELDQELPFHRPDPSDENQLKIFQDFRKNKFVYKELSSRCPVADLEDVYHQLSLITPAKYNLALPIKTNQGCFVLQYLERSSILMQYVEHTPLSVSTISVQSILNTLACFHLDLSSLTFRLRPERTYESYLLRGIERIINLAPNHKFCDWYLKFIEINLPRLELKFGNIHFDLNPYNLWITPSQEIYFSDFDDVQYGPLIKDVFEVAANFIKIENYQIKADPSLFTSLEAHLFNCISGASSSDVRALLLRPLMNRLYSNEDSTKYSNQEIESRIISFLDFAANFVQVRD